MSSQDTELDNAGKRFRDQPPGAVDFTVMFLTHDALLRDLRRLEAAAAEGRHGEEAVRNGWDTIKHELHIHHVGEDEAVWPQLREKVTAPGELATLDLMEAEHGQIDPLQARVDAAFTTGGAELQSAVKEFAASLALHMEHEEDRALPLVEHHLGPEGWAKYHQYMMGSQGMDEVGFYLAWLLDDAPDSARTKVLGMLPPPVQGLFQQSFEPAYRAAPRWTTPTV